MVRNRYGLYVLFFALQFVPLTIRAQAPQSGVKLFGDVTLSSDHYENGFTQTAKSYSLRTGIGYQWPYFKIGLQGMNVSYPNTNDNLNLRLYLSTRMDFSANATLNVRYDFNQYYRDGSRNGGIISLDLKLFDYHILYSQISKFEGLDITATRYGFQREWDLGSNWVLDFTGSYTSAGDPNLKSYFDFLTVFKYKSSDLVYMIGSNFNSNSNQLDGRGSLGFNVGVGAQF